MIPSFFINVFKKKPSLVHGTSSRWHVVNGEKKPLFIFNKDDGGLLFEHQKMFLNSLGIENDVLFRVNQIHGNHVYVLRKSDVSVDQVSQSESDAIITDILDCPIIVLTADCVPIIIYDSIKHVVGVVHAGRRGTQKQVLTSAIEALSREYNSKPKDLIVGMGPAIRRCCYKVDESCILPFLKKSSLQSALIDKKDKNTFFLDLPEANKLESLQAGVLMENIYTEGPCTSCENDKWYSYRKEGITGRLVTLAMLKSRK
jgi:polyphenol oxidase